MCLLRAAEIFDGIYEKIPILLKQTFYAVKCSPSFAYYFSPAIMIHLHLQVYYSPLSKLKPLYDVGMYVFISPTF